MTELRTAQLLLQEWGDSDREPFAALNADPEVMAHFPAPLTRRRATRSSAMSSLTPPSTATGSGRSRTRADSSASPV